MSQPEKATRGRGSKIEQLPDDVKGLLNALLRDKQYSQQEILAEVNKQLDELGLPEDEQISKSGLNRYASKMAKIGKRMQETHATAEAWVAKLGEKPSGDIGKLLINMTQTMAFDIAEGAMSEEGPASLGMVKELALTVQRLEKTRTDSIKNEKEIRKAFAEEAADKAGTVAKAAGLTKEAVQTIKNEILGIA
ncbi:MAG: DUF3486 family protein [Oleispira sp.]|nr:DUF3486 family protein [Oleispira sp.]